MSDYTLLRRALVSNDTNRPNISNKLPGPMLPPPEPPPELGVLLALLELLPTERLTGFNASAVFGLGSSTTIPVTNTR